MTTKRKTKAKPEPTPVIISGCTITMGAAMETELEMIRAVKAGFDVLNQIKARNIVGMNIEAPKEPVR